MADVLSKKSVKTSISHKRNTFFKYMFLIISMLLVLALIIIFTVGKSISESDSTELKVDFYNSLCDNPFGKLFALLIFGNEPPSFPSIAPECINSEADNIKILFSKGERTVQRIDFTYDNNGYNGIMLAINNPLSFSIGSSTQGSNVLSEIARVEHAYSAFSFTDSGKDNLLIDGSVSSIEGREGDIAYLGFDKSGIMHFGSGSTDEIKSLKLCFATEQKISSLITDGVPCSFEMTKGDIGTNTLSIAQCADGSVLVLLLDKTASYREITEIFYRYSAVNAAVIYTGDCVGIITDGEVFSFNDEFKAKEFSSAWIIN